MSQRLKPLLPAFLVLLVALGYATWRLASAEWDPIALAEIGTRFSEGDPDGTEGYDGQFVYYVATDPRPANAMDHLDDPAYRYQRILLPILARFLSIGKLSWIPWMLLAINLTAHFLGTWAVSEFLNDHELSRWYCLIYGLWVGLVASVGLYLHEPLAYCLVAIGWWLRLRGKRLTGSIFLGLALFTKETTLLFWLAALINDLQNKERKRSIIGLILGLLLFAGWQVWLWQVFGTPGFGIRGAGATSFELIPFNGLWRVGLASLSALALYVVIFGPTIVIPTTWAVIASIKRIWNNWSHSEGWSLLLNSLAIVFLPHSTFREPLGLLRFATGFILAVIFFTAENKWKKALNYALMWIPLVIILFNP
jgi:hypothetical protein